MAMNVVKEILLIGMSPYSFKNDDGELVEGLTVHYVAPDEKLENGVGLKPIKARMDVKEYQRYQNQELPALAKLNGNFMLSTGRVEIISFTDFKPLIPSK